MLLNERVVKNSFASVGYEWNGGLHINMMAFLCGVLIAQRYWPCFLLIPNLNACILTHIGWKWHFKCIRLSLAEFVVRMRSSFKKYTVLESHILTLLYQPLLDALGVSVFWRLCASRLWRGRWDVLGISECYRAVTFNACCKDTEGEIVIAIPAYLSLYFYFSLTCWKTNFGGSPRSQSVSDCSTCC